MFLLLLLLFPTHWASRGITYLKLYPIVVIAHIFSGQLRNSKVIFHTDNWAVMNILNKASSKLLLMSLVRPLMVLSLKNNFTITSKHISGHSNVTPDRISRLQVIQLDLSEAGLETHKLLFLRNGTS